MVEQLYVRLGLHCEVGFQPCTLGKKRDVPVKYINLLPFLIDQGNAAPDCKGTDDGASYYYRKTVIMASLVFCASDSISI